MLPDKLRADRPNPLEAMPSFHDVRCPSCGAEARRDIETLEAYSSPWWYYLICAAPAAEEIFNGPHVAEWMPVDVMIGGMDQARTCFFDIRTITAALNQLGVVSETQPVRSLLMTGMVKQEGRKMSKSSGNTIDPMELIERHGADAVRIAVLWAVAPDQDFNWRDDLVRKAAALLRKIRLFVERRRDTTRAVTTYRVERAQGRLQRIERWVNAAERHVTDCLARNAFHIGMNQVATLVERLARRGGRRVHCCRRRTGIYRQVHRSSDSAVCAAPPGRIMGGARSG